LIGLYIIAAEVSFLSINTGVEYVKNEFMHYRRKPIKNQRTGKGAAMMPSKAPTIKAGTAMNIKRAVMRARINRSNNPVTMVRSNGTAAALTPRSDRTTAADTPMPIEKAGRTATNSYARLS